MSQQLIIRPSLVIERPVMEVFDYLCWVGNLPKWAPFLQASWFAEDGEGKRPLDPNRRMGMGDEIHSKFWFGPLLNIKARGVVTEFVWGRRLAFKALVNENLSRILMEPGTLPWVWPLWVGYETSPALTSPILTATLVSMRVEPWSWSLGLPDLIRPFASDYANHTLNSLKRSVEFAEPTYVEPTVFFSYRRTEHEYVSGRIFRTLEAEFGPIVFRDTDSIAPGENFERIIEDKLGQCKVFLTLIHAKWIDTLEERKKKRQIDWVLQELKWALKSDSLKDNVIPILLANAQMPTRAQLKKFEIETLSKCNFLQVRPDPDFEADMNAVVQAVWKKLRTT